MSGIKRKNYDPNFKAKVVLESMQPTTTIEQVRIRYNLHSSIINRWRNQFKKNAHLVFTEPVKKQKPEESPEYLKNIIGNLTVENDILKKALSVWD